MIIVIIIAKDHIVPSGGGNILNSTGYACVEGVCNIGKKVTYGERAASPEAFCYQIVIVLEPLRSPRTFVRVSSLAYP